MIDRLFNVDSKDVFDNPFFHGEYDLLICNSLKGFYRRLCDDQHGIPTNPPL